MKPENLQALRTSFLLSTLFLVVYGSTNALASLRHHVPTAAFEWERALPFVPALIIPYMSIDLFFVAAPFLCRTDTERRTLAARIAAAILIAGACFLLFPLRFAFDRPPAGGVLGVIFNHFRELDQPFNQLPSLHIALCALLAPVYLRRSKPALRAALALWFLLIALSAVLTYQHHTIDVLGGLFLAAFCFHFFQDRPLRTTSPPAAANHRVAWYYLTGAILCVAAIPFAFSYTWPFLWPASSLAFTAAAYFGLGPGIFRKTDGRLPVTAWLLFWPVLLGHRLSLIWYARQCRPWDQLTGTLWIGRTLSPAEARRAVDAGVSAVLDLTAEFSEPAPFRSLNYLHLPILDLTAPSPAQLDLAVAFLRDQPDDAVVYIHCKIGYSRTAAVAGAYLLASGRAADAPSAIALLRAARPSIVIRSEARHALEAYARRTPALNSPTPLPARSAPPASASTPSPTAPPP